jgi:hypothetical protein
VDRASLSQGECRGFESRRGHTAGNSPLTKVEFYDILKTPCERGRLVDPLSVGKRTRRQGPAMPNSRAFRFPRTRFISYSTANQIKEKNIPARLFEVYQEQRVGLEALRAKYGPKSKPLLIGSSLACQWRLNRNSLHLPNPGRRRHASGRKKCRLMLSRRGVWQ